ncbi:multifunctional beta-oxidation protein [Malassezia pachydermatis]|uniref:Multifunctional beta-oxidation protein n=1 Tax=Malassezia pachydermatis TaxID=77020 RepID=A0A0M9VP67_9BASI|nr:multifunctional beta-oxidation protein [Malassezia pachydermatis]KOS13932.1 multifunctional beta-oxidation protein [Malassezia pachydermatis]
MADFPATENGKISFKNRVVVITGAGGGLGKTYALFFASRGAKVLVNDLGQTPDGKKAADLVVEEITKNGGEAIANYDSNTEGAKIIQQVIDKWGRVDILINNAGILRDKSFKSMSDKEWDQVMAVHVHGSFACAHAAWPHMRKQKFGRIINTSSAAGLYGNFGQSNYSAAKMALVAFSKTLGIEGEKYNIYANAIAPVAASKMTETVMPPEMLENLKPEYVVPIVAFLCSAHNEGVNGEVFEMGAGFYAMLRRERSHGHVFRTDKTFTPEAVREAMDKVLDFDEKPDYPVRITDTNYLELLERAKEAPENAQGDEKINYKDQTVLVTGAGAGLGRAYALLFASLGANVVVNDMSEKNAMAVVEEIKKAGGKAAPSIGSVEDGEKLVQDAVNAFGGLHTVVNNAGILRDKSFAGATEKDWKLVLDVHLRGTYKVCKAAWPIFMKQKYGRIVNTTSAVGIYGNFGQANYSTAKSGILGFTQTLAVEGEKYNILANTIAPNAGTAMTATIWPQEMVDAFKPEYVAPLVAYLGGPGCDVTKNLYEVSGGWIAATRWQRAGGHAFSTGKPVTPEMVEKKWSKITDFDPERASWPSAPSESLGDMVANFGNEDEDDEAEEGGDDFIDAEDPEEVKAAKKADLEAGEYTYTERDVILYNLGIGATEKDLNFVYEQADEFQAVPTFGVIPMFSSLGAVSYDFLPNFSPMMLLHGEQYLAIKGEIPTEGTLVSKPRIIEVLDKGKAAAVTVQITTTNKSTGEVVFENQGTFFIRGSGGFNGKKTGRDRGNASAPNAVPKRAADKVVREKTAESQAALYRLSGDYNPLHIDPNFASVGGFDKPILHGLCSFGISGKHVFQTYGPVKDIKVRFTGHVFPGETLETSMWKEGDKVLFQTRVVERDTIALGAAAATLA